MDQTTEATSPSAGSESPGAAPAGPAASSQDRAATGVPSDTGPGQATDAAPAAPVKDAAPKQAADKRDLLSVVKKAYADTRKGDAKPDEAASASDGKADDAGIEAEEAEEADGVSASYDPKEREKLLRQRKKWRTEALDLRKKVDDLEAAGKAHEPIVRDYQQLDQFMRHTGITQDVAVDAIQIAALTRTNPAKARERLVAIVQEIDQYLGNAVVDQDLQQRVQDGTIDEASAKELQRARYHERHLKHEVDATRQTYERSQHEARARSVADAVGSSVAAWETQKRQRDPDFDKKTAMLEMATGAIYAANNIRGPRSPQEAVQIMEMAYAEVQRQFKAFAPGTTARNAPPRIEHGGSPTGSTSAAAPKSLAEAVKLGYQQSRQRMAAG